MLSPKSKTVNATTSSDLPKPEVAVRCGRLRSVSTISSDIRTARYPTNGPEYIVNRSYSNVRNNRSPNYGRHGSMSGGDNYVVTVVSPSSDQLQRRLSNEEIIDMMEKEQDAIVVRLMRDIDTLKHEIKCLQNAGRPQTPRRSLSIDDRLAGSGTEYIEGKKAKRKLSSESLITQGIDNKQMLDELQRLRMENAQLRHALNQAQNYHKGSSVA